MNKDLDKWIFDIEGMTCAGCAATIEKRLNELPGISEAHVNFATAKAYITLDESKISADEIAKQVAKIGYKAALHQAEELETITLNIKGMSCTSCVSNIESILGNSEGIKKVDINFANEKGIITYDPTVIKLADIKKIVASVGYEAEVQDDTVVEEKDKSIQIAYKKMLYAAILAGTIMTLMIIRMFGVKIPAYHLLTVLLGFPVVFILGSKVHHSSWLSIKNKVANMDVLVSLGSLPPFIIGLSGFFWQVQTFIEMAATIMTFHLIGKYLETKAKGKTSEAIKKLIKLGAKTARIQRGDEEIEVSVKELVIGDLMIIRPGEKIPIDGIIIEGNTNIDESMVTGESMPVFRQEGDEIIGATINKQGYIKAKVTKTGKETFLAQVIKLVEQCQGSKVPIQDFADRVTGYFVPIILVLTFLTFLSFNIFPSFHRIIIEWGATFLPWVNPDLTNLTLAFITATAVLVIACPCALGLGTPTALMVGSGLGAENGILIRSGEAVQTLREVKAVAFDKTGTITSGKPVVTDVITYNNYGEQELLLYAASLENSSEHPLAQAIIDKSKEYEIDLLPVKEVSAISGKGIKGLIEGKEVLAGNRRMLEDHQISYQIAESDIQKLEAEAKTLLLVAINKKLAGLLAVADQIKEDSVTAISRLNEMGITTIMLTGDNYKTAQAIAEKAGIKKIAAEILPEGKVNEIIKLQKEFGIVAMVGDGINDAPALKQANVGIALGTGTDIAIESADVTLIRSELVNVVYAIKLSKAIFRKIKENFFWAWFYNLIAVPVAMLGLLHPMIGAAAMSMSSLNVVYNSLRLKKFRLREG
ncbi:MAG: heavy metal translocating P-type ATPase [Candidatus Cloacimonetes bacterium]|nr:heavy metal translocating P-type ATPase [Candidatus Cloacimonadota bacterium]